MSVSILVHYIVFDSELSIYLLEVDQGSAEAAEALKKTIKFYSNCELRH